MHSGRRLSREHEAKSNSENPARRTERRHTNYLGLRAHAERGQKFCTRSQSYVQRGECRER